MAINKSDLSEVTFYSCTTRGDYEKENSKDSGGLYVFRDGTGIYRGNDAVSGPAPIQIVAKADESILKDAQNSASFLKYTCGYDCELSFTRLSRYLIGPGNRPIRFIDHTGKVIELYAVGYDSNVRKYTLCNTYSGIAYTLSEDNSAAFEIASVTYRVELYADRLIVEISSNRIPTLALLNKSLNAVSQLISSLELTHTSDVEGINNRVSEMRSVLLQLSNIVYGYTDDAGQAHSGLIHKLNDAQTWISSFDKSYTEYKTSVANKFKSIEETIEGHSKTLDELSEFDTQVSKLLNGHEDNPGLISDVAALKAQLFWKVILPEQSGDDGPSEDL